MSKKINFLKIALPISSFLPTLGGAEIGLHNIAMQLRTKGHRPVVITSYAHVSALKKNGWNIPYDVVPYPPRLLTLLTNKPSIGGRALRWFHSFIQRRYGFDVWHATFGYPVGVAVIEFCRAKNIPHLVRCVGDDIQIKSEIGYGMRLNPHIDKQVRHWLPRAQRLVAITESVVAEYHALGVDEARIVRIPNGIDLPRFKAHTPQNDVREHLGISPTTRVFLALGRHHPKKNFAQLIEAAAKLHAKVKIPFAVIIAGRDVNALETFVAKRGVGDIVHLCEPGTEKGNRDGSLELPSDEILDYYIAADIFVMPSLIETFGIVTIEAMAAGLPVIAADSPGSVDVIRGGKDGLLYDGSLEALTQAMENWLEDSDECRDYARKSCLRAEDFDWAKIVDRYVQEYRKGEA